MEFQAIIGGEFDIFSGGEDLGSFFQRRLIVEFVGVKDQVRFAGEDNRGGYEIKKDDDPQEKGEEVTQDFFESIHGSVK